MIQRLSAMRVFTVMAITLGCWATINNTPSQATPLTFAYEGEVNFTDGDPVLRLFIGETLRMQYTFESSTPDTDPSPRNGLYEGAISSLIVRLGSNQWEADPVSINPISIFFNPHPTGSVADVYVYKFSANKLDGPALNGTLSPGIFLFSLDEEGRVPFPSDSLPATQPDPTLFDGFANINAIRLSFDIDDSDIGIISAENFNGNLRIIPPFFQPTPIPEPSTILLLGTGVLGLSIYRRRNVRREKDVDCN